MVTDDDHLWSQVVDALRPTSIELMRTPLGDASPVLGPQLLLVHIAHPRAEQLDVREIRRLRGADVRVVLICEQINLRSLRRFLDAGLNGLVLASQLQTALAAAVAAALAGQISVPHGVGSLLRRRPLSFREKEILALAVLGYTNGQIGGRLYLAESTVKSHLSSSFAKLGIGSRSEAAALVNDPDESLGMEIRRIAERLETPLLAPAV